VFPSELVLEIVARSDVATLLRCAACCKPLRLEILSPAFIWRVCHGPAAVVPPRLLCLLPRASRGSPPPPPFSLAHPATPAAAYLSERHLAQFVSRGAADLLARYEPVTSRRGLVVLRRRHRSSVRWKLGICVYDPMSGGRSFLPDPPEMPRNGGFSTTVLLTASDGIGCSFLLLAVDFLDNASSIKVLTFSSPDAPGGGGGVWSPVTLIPTDDSLPNAGCSAVVLGGTVHWVMNSGRDSSHVLTYDVRAATAGSIELPMYRGDGILSLASSPDGKLTVLVGDKFKISVWRLLSTTGAATTATGWTLHSVIDTEATLRSLAPGSLPDDEAIMFVSLGEMSGVVLLKLLGDREERLVALDVETKEMHWVSSQGQIRPFPFEVDLESRLSAMKTF
jgi:hypothetical protein